MSKISEISQLANILHENGDQVLNALSKLSLNAVLLQKLNKEFELLLNGSQYSESSFQVLANTHGSSQLLKDLHFLHDFIQKIVGLKLTYSPNFTLQQDKIDISKFKSIKYLELKKIPIKEVVGLKNVRSQLKSIVCIKCLSVIEDLLANCGGDNSSGFVWSELIEAVLSFNNIKVVDTSVAFAPWLQVLDLSYNQITDVKAIECLPNLKYVNLSFNCLSVIPTFNKSARKKIELLVIKNNYIEDLKGLLGLTHLIELDLSNNWISSWENLEPLLLISTLQWLSLEGNPINFHSYYRQRISGYLHINASFCDFYLDKVKLSKKEKSVVGIKLCGNNSLSKCEVEELSSKKDSFTNLSSVKKQGSMSKKSGKSRVVFIPNLDDGTYEETTSCNSPNDLMKSSTDHLITKKRIENTRSTYGIDNWLVHGSSVVQDILGLPPIQVSTSTPCDDICLNAALDSVNVNTPFNVVTTVAVIEKPPESQSFILEKSDIDSFVTGHEESNSSNYLSAISSGEKEENSKESNMNINEKSTKDVSPDIEEIQELEEVEELDIGENEKVFVVSKEVKTNSNETKQQEMFLTIRENELLEREPNRGKINTKWSTASLESCVKLKSNKLQLVFDTIIRDKRERIYFLEEQEASILYKELVKILESRTLSDMNQIVYKCENCNSQFSKEMKSRKSEYNIWCPFCNSKFILELDEVPLPSSEVEKKASEINKSKIPDTKVSHSRSSSSGGFFQSFIKQNDNKMAKSVSQSSIGSAASLNEVSDLPTSQTGNVKRSDSDIEILSNPSQSSIEVIDGAGRDVSENIPKRKDSSEDKPCVILESALTAVNNFPGLTESSSSGSITDSICTAYEANNVAVSTINSKENKKILAEEFEGKEVENSSLLNNEPLLQEMLNKTKAILTVKKSLDVIYYSYSDFTNLDHRIKLFLYTNVFEDASEEFSFGLRAYILPMNENKAFPSYVIASSKKLYFLKIVNIEEGDDARTFLKKVDSLSFYLNAIKCIYMLAWHQGLGIKIQSSNIKYKEYLILLKNSSRTCNFFKFLKSLDSIKSTEIIEEPLKQTSLSILHILLTSTFLNDYSILYFCLFNNCDVMNQNSYKYFDSGGILTNSTDLILFIGKLNWLFDSSEKPPNPEYSQKLINLKQVLTHNSFIILQFFDNGKETEVWKLAMEGEESHESLIKSLKECWKNPLFTSLLN